MEDIPLGSTGTLEKFAVMQVGPPGFQVPYVIGYVRTREGVLVFTPITGFEPKDEALKIGEAMELCETCPRNWHPSSLCCNHINATAAGSTKATAFVITNGAYYINQLLDQGYEI